MSHLKARLLLAVGSICLLSAVMYAGDYVTIRYRAGHNRNAFGSVTVTRFYAVHEKNNKIEYDFVPPENRTCVHSLFPQLGYLPCWYVSRHTEERVEI